MISITADILNQNWRPLLLYPGILFGLGAAYALNWLWLSTGDRHRIARLRAPWRPWLSLVKLLSKERTVVTGGPSSSLISTLGVLSIASVLAALSMLPAPGVEQRAFPGDVLLLSFLIEFPVAARIAIGLLVPGPYSRTGASRQALLSSAYALPVAIALISVANLGGTISLRTISVHPSDQTEVLVRAVAALAMFMCIPARLGQAPFAVSRAGLDVAGGMEADVSGSHLAVLQVSRALEAVAVIGMTISIGLPVFSQAPGISGALYGLAIVLAGLVLRLAGGLVPRISVSRIRAAHWWGTGAMISPTFIAFVSLGLPAALKLLQR